MKNKKLKKLIKKAQKMHGEIHSMQRIFVTSRRDNMLNKAVKRCSDLINYLERAKK